MANIQEQDEITSPVCGWTAVTATGLVVIPVPQSLQDAFSNILRLAALWRDAAAMIPSLPDHKNR